MCHSCLTSKPCFWIFLWISNGNQTRSCIQLGFYSLGQITLLLTHTNGLFSKSVASTLLSEAAVTACFCFWTFPFFKKINFYWSIFAFQCCVSFCCTAKWISYMSTYIPSLLDLPSTPPPSRPSRSSQSTKLGFLWVLDLPQRIMILAYILPMMFRMYSG